MNLKEFNERLNKINLNLRVDKRVSYDNGKVSYDTWLEYWNHTNNKWSILHTLGYFKSEEVAMNKTKNWLEINKIKY